MKKIKVILFVVSVLVMLNIYSYASSNTESVVRYYVQVGVFNEKNNADELFRGLILNDFEVIRSYNGKHYIGVGYFSSEAKAKSELLKLKKIGYQGIVKNKSLTNTLEEEKTKDTTEVKTITKVNTTTENVEANPQNNENLLSSNVEKDEYGSRNYSFTEDVALKGIFGSHLLFFNVDKNWEIKSGCYLDLTYTRSAIPSKRNSTITVLINDIPISTNFMTENESGTETLRIPISIKQIENGYNTIRIQTYHRITDYICEDDINPGNWVNLSKSSYVHLNFAEKKDTLSVKEYPYPYILENNNFAVNADIVVPQNAKNCEIEAALMLSEDFGRKGKFQFIETNILDLQEYSKNRNRNGILISIKENLPKEILNATEPRMFNLAIDDALIYEIDMPYNKKYRMMVITSENEESLKHAVEVLSNEKMVSQMKNQYQVIPLSLEMPKVDNKMREHVTLEELGYTNSIIEGSKFSSVSYGIVVPPSWKLSEGTSFKFKIRYSEVLDYDNSSLSVSVNGIPIGSRQFQENLSSDANYEFMLPRELLNSKYLQVQLSFSLDTDRNCEDISYDPNVWGYISNQSSIYLPHEIREKYYLNDYSAPFVIEGELQPLVISLAENPNAIEMGIASNIMAYMGRDLDEVGEVKIAREENINKDFKFNEIIIGTPDRNQYIKDLNEEAFLKFRPDFLSFITNDKMSFLSRYDQEIAAIQLLRKDESTYKMVVSSLEERFFANASVLLSDPGFTSYLDGEVVTVDEGGITQAIYFNEPNKNEYKEDKNVEKVNKKKNAKTEEETRNFLLFGLIIAIILLIVILVLHRLKKYKIDSTH